MKTISQMILESPILSNIGLCNQNWISNQFLRKASTHFLHAQLIFGNRYESQKDMCLAFIAMHPGMMYNTELFYISYQFISNRQ